MAAESSFRSCFRSSSTSPRYPPRGSASALGGTPGAPQGLSDLAIVGDLRGAGYFWAIELVKDRDTRQPFPAEEKESILRGFVAGALFEAGLICRTDDRGDPVIQLAPPLTCGPEEFDTIETVLREVLTEAGERVRN